MRLEVSVAAAAVAVSTFAGSVDANRAHELADGWMSGSGDPVVEVYSVTNGSSVSHHVARTESGSALFIAADDRIYPVLAQSYSVFNRDGSPKIPKEHPLWSMVVDGATGSLSRVNSRLLSSSPSDEQQVNRRAWDRYSSKRKSLSSSVTPVPGAFGQVVLSGFEDGGVYTHWNQAVATKDFHGTSPLYNYYMLPAGIGGAGPSGLDIQDAVFASQYPCGCVATALAAAAQYQRFAGIVSSPAFTNSIFVITNGYGTTSSAHFNKTVSLVPGAYDWSLLPSNYGGDAPAAFSDAGISPQARELIGRVTYNYGIAVDMRYSENSSGASHSLDPFMTGTVTGPSGFLDFTASTIDHAHVNRGSTLFSSGFSSAKKSRAIDAAIRLGEPVVMNVAGSSGRHCILAVGTRGESDSERYIKVFMGWGGDGDTWFYGGGERIGTMFSSIESASVTGGEGHPTTFLREEFTGCSTGMGTVYPSSMSVSSSVSNVVVTSQNNRTTIVGYVFPYYPESGSGPGSLSAGATFSFPPFVVSGVTLTPSSYSKYSTSTYRFNGCQYGRYVYYYPASSQNRFVDDSFSVSAEGSKANGFPHGTPEDLYNVMFSAFTNNKPVVVVSGAHGSSGPVVSELKTGPSASLLGQCVVYFVDTASDRRNGIVDGYYSYMVFDSAGGGTPMSVWDSDSGYRLSYGTFTNATEIYSVLSEGISRYASLPRNRDNTYGMKWYKHPKIDTNPYYVPAGTTSLDMNSVRGRGYTSVHATGLVTMSRSNVSYSDTTILYVDFSQCPCPSSSGQLFRNFKALVTTDGLPSGFTYVPSYCYASCTSLEYIDALPSGVTTLGTGAFYGCTSLKSAAVPGSVRSIGQQCFQNCVSLDNTDGIGNVTSMGTSVFSMMTGGADQGHPFAITEWPISSIPGYSFNNRNGISSLSDLPENVTSFDDNALNGLRGIENLVIPSHVKTFGSSCFAYMYQVRTIDLLGTTGEFSIGNNAFYQTGASQESCIIVFHCTKSELQSKPYYPFTPYTGQGMVFRCTDGDINL